MSVAPLDVPVRYSVEAVGPDAMRARMLMYLDLAHDRLMALSVAIEQDRVAHDTLMNAFWALRWAHAVALNGWDRGGSA